MKIRNLIALLTLSGSVWAQKEITLPAFNGIGLDAPLSIQLVHDTAAKAILNDANDKVSFTVKNDILYIEMEGKVADRDQAIKVYFVDLKSIAINGAGQIETGAHTTVSAEQFKIESNGASRIKLALAVKKLDIQATGAAKLTLSGKADQVKCGIDGAAKLIAGDLKTMDFDLESNGASYYTINVANSLEVDASGASKGVYSGSPINRKIQVNGVAKITDATTGDQMTDSRNADKDTTRISLGKKKYMIIDESKDADENTDNDNSKDVEKGKGKKTKRLEMKHVYSGFELGLNSFASKDLNLDIPAPYSNLTCKPEKSIFAGINILEGDAQLIKNKLALTTGLGFEFQNFEMGGLYSLKPNATGVQFDSSLVPFTKNLLYNFNLNVPLLLKFAPRNQKSRNGFHFAVGVIGTYKAHSHLTMENSSRGFETKTKIEDDFNINPFRLAATVRVGYGWFRAFANYSLTPYFKQSGGSPDIRVFSAGLTLIPFQ